MHDCVTKHTNHTARDRRNGTDWFMFKERWPIRCSPDEMHPRSARRIAIALLPVECVFSDASKPNLLWHSIACFDSFEKKPRMRNRERKKVEKYCGTRVQIGQISWESSLLTIHQKFYKISVHFIAYISFDVISKSFLSICISSMWRKDKSSFKKKKKKRSNLIVCNLSNLSDCRPRSNEKRKRGRENRRRQRDFGN